MKPDEILRCLPEGSYSQITFVDTSQIIREEPGYDLYQAFNRVYGNGQQGMVFTGDLPQSLSSFETELNAQLRAYELKELDEVQRYASVQEMHASIQKDWPRAVPLRKDLEDETLQVSSIIVQQRDTLSVLTFADINVVMERAVSSGELTKSAEQWGERQVFEINSLRMRSSLADKNWCIATDQNELLIADSLRLLKQMHACSRGQAPTMLDQPEYVDAVADLPLDVYKWTLNFGLPRRQLLHLQLEHGHMPDRIKHAFSESAENMILYSIETSRIDKHYKYVSTEQYPNEEAAQRAMEQHAQNVDQTEQKVRRSQEIPEEVKQLMRYREKQTTYKRDGSVITISFVLDSEYLKLSRDWKQERKNLEEEEKN